MGAAMVRAINDISHLIGARTIAKCIETEKMFASLYRLRVNYGQGSFIATPRPIEELFKPSHREPKLALIRS